MAIEWHIARNGESRGPFTTQEFHKAIDNGEVLPTDHVWRSDGPDWTSAEPYVAASQSNRLPLLGMAGAIAALLVLLGATYWTLPSKLGALTELSIPSQEIPQPGETGTGVGLSGDAIRAHLLQEEPSTAIYRALATKDPAAFDALVSYLESLQIADANAATWQARAYMMGTVAKPKLKNLSDGEMVELMEITRDMSVELAEANAKTCLDVALERPTEDYRSLISPTLQERESNFFVRLLDTPDREIELPTAARAQEINAGVAQRLVQQHPDKVHLLDLANVAPADEKAACLIFVDYLNGILALPEADRAAMLRVLNVNPALLQTQEAEAAAPQEEVPAAPQEPLMVDPTQEFPSTNPPPAP